MLFSNSTAQLQYVEYGNMKYFNPEVEVLHEVEAVGVCIVLWYIVVRVHPGTLR